MTSELTIEALPQLTEHLRRLPKSQLKARYQPADLDGAIIAAARYAKKYQAVYYVYSSNYYMQGIYRITYKESEALCSVGNNYKDKRHYAIHPDLSAELRSLY